MTTLVAKTSFDERLRDALMDAKRHHARTKIAATSNPAHRPGHVKAFAATRFLQVVSNYHQANDENDLVNPEAVLAGGLVAFTTLASGDLQRVHQQAQPRPTKDGPGVNTARVALFKQAVGDYPNLLRGALDAYDKLLQQLRK